MPPVGAAAPARGSRRSFRCKRWSGRDAFEDGRRFEERSRTQGGCRDYYRDIDRPRRSVAADDAFRDEDINRQGHVHTPSTSPAADMASLTRETPPERRGDENRPQRQDPGLTAEMNADGRLAWDVPAGKWTVLRIGHTSTGQDNHPTPESGRGLECDKLSKAAIAGPFRRIPEKTLIADARAARGRDKVL